jgi:RNA polymerase sigma factor (sigma-70 family)
MGQELNRQQRTLVSLSLWMADRVARTAARCTRHLTFDDLSQIARTALSLAALRFDPAKEVPFEKFAWKRIVGAVLRALTGESKHKRRTVDAFLTMLDAPVEVGDSFVDTDEEVSRRIDERDDDAALAVFLSMTSDDWQAEGEQGLVRRETSVRAKHLVQGALDSLEEVQRRVVVLRYWEALDWAAVTEHMGLSKTTVQYHERQARTHIRRYLLAHGLKSDT